MRALLWPIYGGSERILLDAAGEVGLPPARSSPAVRLLIMLKESAHTDIADAPTGCDLELRLSAHCRATTNPTFIARPASPTTALCPVGAVSGNPNTSRAASNLLRMLSTRWRAEGLKSASVGENVYVNSRDQHAAEGRPALIRRLARAGVNTKRSRPVMTLGQASHEVTTALGSEVPSFISVFAGRIADTGRDPIP